MHSILAPVVPVDDELELPAIQGMEPVGHTNAIMPIVGTGCS